MNHRDVRFQPLHNVLNNTSKELLKEGVGAQKKQVRMILAEEEEQESHVLKGLLSAILFNCGLLFCLRGVQNTETLS